MNRKLYLIAVLLAGQQAMAQIPEDALRMSWNVPQGSARSQAIGGAMGALGGEITNLWVNPAGLGFYKTSELVLSPGFTMAKSKGSFRETDASADGLNRFNLGASGFVFGWGDKYSKWSSKAFSIGVNRTANFAGSYYYKGTNDYSSFTEPLANEFFNYYTNQRHNNPSLTDEQIINNAIDDRSVSVLTRMSLYTYLVDVEKGPNGQGTVFSRAEDVGIVNQEKQITTKGGITEIALGFASNMDDKLYIGGSVGIPIVNYQRNSTFTESDASKVLNDFNYSRYTEEFTSKGVGINAKLGVIFKPVERLRIGVAVHSPSLYALKDKTSSKMVTDVEDLFPGKPGLDSIQSPILFDAKKDPEFKYDLVSPWKFMVSGSYVLNEVEDISRQKGFISADIEYVTYGSSRFNEAEDNGEGEYFKQVTEAVKKSYKGALNFRVGGELKFNTIMTRLGFAYYGNPYEDKELKAHKMNLSGGLGYRDHGIFIDVTYVHSLNKDSDFPYRVDAPRANTYATIKDQSSNIMLTFGIKL
ncbi:hypothetical protein D3H65_30450 [Paraflavitalea soli]|uniref:Aromatic hydrocarbon degradation protein n=1 Tax=Paraflavitalea soli TaxID=2315862 RepID=A0A3B7MX57_9BACT|nr:hypothetical protein [Paraflavitalea soli]AXY78053.1 hypothetical protein D3H65_30450 [Paraflavitalea soli]